MTIDGRRNEVFGQEKANALFHPALRYLKFVGSSRLIIGQAFRLRAFRAVVRVLDR